jgi:competence protein ComEC
VQALPALPEWHICAVVLIGSSALALQRRIIWPLGFALGFAWTSYFAALALSARLPPDLDRHDVQLSGWVDDFPEVSAERTRFSVMVESSAVNELIGRRVRLSWYDPSQSLHPGQSVEITARLRVPHGFVNPAGFDYERWLLLERLSATGYVREFDSSGQQQVGLAPALLRLRADIRQRIFTELHSPTAAALVTALAIGERSAFSDADWDSFRRTGTSHLVAISGLHVGIVAMAVLSIAHLLLRFAPLERGRLVAGLLALSAAGCYAALAGFSVSTLRAFFMLAVALTIAGMLRRVSSLHGILFAALLVTAIDPLATLSGSFWLSFGAVATLLLVTVARDAMPRRSRIAWSVDAWRVQLAITCAAVPVGAAMFGEFSLIALPVNLIAIPLFSFVFVPYVLLCVVLSMANLMPEWAWRILGSLADFTMTALEYLSDFSYASVVAPRPGFLILLLAFTGALLLLPITPARSRVAAIGALVPLVWPRPDLLPRDAFRLTVLDVGHGLAAIVETRSYLLIYDAGARFASGFDIGADVLLPALGSRRAPDALVISHADNDHSGGAAAVVDAFPAIEVITGPDFDMPASTDCVQGRHWVRDGVAFEFVHPPTDFAARGNDSSCVLRIAGSGGSALLSGDVERAGETALIAGGVVKADVVIAPHHGSETSSSAALVAATQPSVVIVSAGFGNRWNFPREPVVRRWCAAGAEVYVTGEHGAVEVAFERSALRVREMRRAVPRYWRPSAPSRCGESTGVTL